MLNKIKIPLFATFLIIAILVFQGIQIISLSKKDIEYNDILSLVTEVNQVKNSIDNLNFKSNLIYKYAVLDRNLNALYSNLEITPSNMDFQILKYKNYIYYKSYFFYENELYYVVVSKKIKYEKVVLIAFLMLTMTIIIIALIMYFAYRGIVKPHLEQRNLMNTFFNDAMHELKTPLGVASINLEMLEVKNKYTHRIKAALRQMKVTYEDVEFFIKNEKITFSKKILHLTTFLSDRINFSNTIARNKEIEIISDLEPNLDIFMSEVEVSRIIDNTILNAIKYSHVNSKIIIKLRKENSYAVFEVQDFGVGIKDTNAIWNRYTREDTSQGGFGLGLNIVLNICLKNDILYSVKSKYGKGSTFTYKIPLYEEKLFDNV